MPIKPCPFCGGDPEIDTFTTALERVPRYRVRCTACAEATSWDFWSEEDAIRAWDEMEDDDEYAKPDRDA